MSRDLFTMRFFNRKYSRRQSNPLGSLHSQIRFHNSSLCPGYIGDCGTRLRDHLGYKFNKWIKLPEKAKRLYWEVRTKRGTNQ